MISVGKVAILTQREWASFFRSPIAYMASVTFLVVAGWMAFSNLFIMGRADMRHVFNPTLFSPSMMLLILAPALTMRLVAEERKVGTYELLATMPISCGDIIVAKFLACFGMVALMVASTGIYGFSIGLLGDLDKGPVVCGYLGLLLYCGSLVGCGIWTSTWTKNQMVAFVAAFLLCAFLYYIHWLQFYVPQRLVWLVSFISLASHLENMAKGVIDSRDVLYYLSLTFCSLVLATRCLQQRHL